MDRFSHKFIWNHSYNKRFEYVAFRDEEYKHV